MPSLFCLDEKRGVGGEGERGENMSDGEKPKISTLQRLDRHSNCGIEMYAGGAFPFGPSIEGEKKKLQGRRGIWLGV